MASALAYMYTRLWREAVDYSKPQINAEGLHFSALISQEIPAL